MSANVPEISTIERTKEFDAGMKALVEEKE
jgi:hypothetical protein